MNSQTVVAPSAETQVKPDRYWIQEVLGGNEEAFTPLINKYKEQLFELACRMLKNRSEAEDILQDAFLQAYRHLGDFRYDSQFSTWLYSIVLNRVRNRMRQNKVLHWYSLDVRRTDREDVRLPELPHKAPTLDSLTEKRMELERIQKVVATFPAHYQSIFIMHYFNNLQLEEVAHCLGRPLGTVKVYLHRARKLLYKRLKGEESSLAPEQTPELALAGV
jgi:RNA polymerase sigma-70 factor, ECF subfamily